jgi:hypothetical protein
MVFAIEDINQRTLKNEWANISLLPAGEVYSAEYIFNVSLKLEAYFYYKRKMHIVRGLLVSIFSLG